MGSVFAEHFNRTIRDLVKRPVFEKEDGSWIKTLSTIAKQYSKRILTSSKLTPIQARLKKNEGFFYQKSLDKRKRLSPKFEVNDLVRVEYLKKTSSKGDTTNWSYKFYKNAEIFLIQNQVITLTIYQNVIMKHY